MTTNYNIPTPIPFTTAESDYQKLIQSGQDYINKESLIEPKIKGNVNSIMGLNKIGSPSIVMCTKSAINKIGGFDETIPYCFIKSTNFVNC